MMFLEVNWSNISADWIGWLMTGYDNVLGNWVFPLIFLGIAGYVYCMSRSAVTAAASICLIFGIFGVTNIFRYPDLATVSMISWLIVIVSFVGVFVTLFTRKRVG